jgi:predicted GNAT family acetyltransferase
MSMSGIAALVEHLLAERIEVPSVTGEKATANAFAELWMSRKGATLQSTKDLRIYKLDVVVPAKPVPGELRLARPVDVYTPPEHRGKGYASALVAALSQSLLAKGWRFSFLYADTANASAASMYRKLGYAPVCDSAHHVFA